jgi:hypothetical protein
MSTVDPFNAVDDTFVASSEGYQDAAYYPEQPEERTESESKDAAILAASYPIMADIADWFARQVEEAMDITNIDLESTLPVEVQVKAYQLYQTKMIEKAREFADYRSEQ